MGKLIETKTVQNEVMKMTFSPDNRGDLEIAVSFPLRGEREDVTTIELGADDARRLARAIVKMVAQPKAPAE